MPAREAAACGERKIAGRGRCEERTLALRLRDAKRGRNLSDEHKAELAAMKEQEQDEQSEKSRESVEAIMMTGMTSMPTGATPRAADGEKAKRDGEVMCWPTELDNWPVCDRCGNDPRERKVTVECAWKNYYLCFWC